MVSSQSSVRIVMIGATGAVGSQVAECLLGDPRTEQLTTIGRRATEGSSAGALREIVADLSRPEDYAAELVGAGTAICTLGVGRPSKMSREDFVRIDRDYVLGFATAAREAGVHHFQLLSSIGVSSTSRSFFLRTKGQLEDGLRGLGFRSLSLFHPSMILTPTNRYGWQQGLTLRVWPLLTPFLRGRLRSARGVRVRVLGKAIAANTFTSEEGESVLEWDDIQRLARFG